MSGNDTKDGKAGPRHAAGGPSTGRKAQGEAGHRALRAVLVVLALLAVTYGAGYAWFSSHFVPGTTVNGIDVSNQDTASLAHEVSDRAAGWTDTVTSPGGFSLTVTADDAGLTVDSYGLAQAALAQTDPARWPLDLASPQHLAVDEATSIDEGHLREVVSAAVQAFDASATQPTNATSAYDASQAAFVITADAAGTALDADAVADIVAADARLLRTQTSLGDEALARPAVAADDQSLVAATNKANGMLALQIPLTKDGTTLAQTDAATIAGWVSIGDDLQVAVSHDAIYAWANGDLGDQVKNSDEEHDWEIDGGKVADALDQRLQDLSSEAVEIPMVAVATRPAESEGARTRGRHVDVNLTTQYARLYDTDGTVLWRSPIVSGNTSEGRGTPTGTFSLNAKATNQTLVGADEDGDGEPDYKSHVSYWMPFVGNSVGLHDASWRSRFGGSIYKTRGSHGCVNLPTDAAAELYSLIRVGDTVYVHW